MLAATDGMSPGWHALCHMHACVCPSLLILGLVMLCFVSDQLPCAVRSWCAQNYAVHQGNLTGGMQISGNLVPSCFPELPCSVPLAIFVDGVQQGERAKQTRLLVVHSAWCE